MKDVSQDYIDKEEASQRQPVEIYHIQYKDFHWRYTSGDTAIEFGGNTWEPATIKRSPARYDTKLEGTRVTVTFARTDPAIARYLAQTPVELSWIRIHKLFRDQDPMEACLIFAGVILSVAVKGLAAEARCAGIDYVINHHFLNWRYQPECNHTIFSEGCGLNEADYELTTTVDVDETGRLLTSDDFASYYDDWFTLGVARHNDEERFIVDHAGNTITLMVPFRDLSSGDTVIVLPGCDGKGSTCATKFDNYKHFLGFPYIPTDNPCLWVNR